MKLMPTFLVIGAARSGTTALYAYLRQHPEVFMSASKEPNFFAFANERLDFAGPGAEFVNNSVTSLDAYQRLFEKAPAAAARGEASPLYLFMPRAAERIRALVPEARLVAVLRDPVEQAYSHYLYARKEMIEPLPDFMAALDAQGERLAAHWQPLFQYTEFARYNVQLRRYFAHFDRAQIRIYRYEDFDRDPLAVLRDIFDLIGVDPTFTPDVSQRVNVGGVPRNAAMQSLVMRPNWVSRTAGSFLPTHARRWLRDRISRSNVQRPAMPAAARERLRRQFREDILELQDLIGQDLSAWIV